MKDIQKRIEEIIDEYASIVDDNSAYFVKPEIKKKYIGKILELIKDYGESLIGEDEIMPSPAFETKYWETLGQNLLKGKQRAKLNGDIK